MNHSYFSWGERPCKLTWLSFTRVSDFFRLVGEPDKGSCLFCFSSFLSRCKKVLPLAESAYQQDLPQYYITSYHESRVWNGFFFEYLIWVFQDCVRGYSCTPPGKKKICNSLSWLLKLWADFAWVKVGSIYRYFEFDYFLFIGLGICSWIIWVCIFFFFCKTLSIDVDQVLKFKFDSAYSFNCRENDFEKGKVYYVCLFFKAFSLEIHWVMV